MLLWNIYRALPSSIQEFIHVFSVRLKHFKFLILKFLILFKDTQSYQDRNMQNCEVLASLASEWGAGGKASPRGFGAEKHFYRCIWQYLWHQRLQSANQTTQVNNLRGTMKQDRLNTWMPTDVLWQIHYGDTRHCGYCLCQRTTQRAWVRVYVWLSGRWAPPRFKTLRFLWRPKKLLLIAIYNFELTNLAEM